MQICTRRFALEIAEESVQFPTRYMYLMHLELNSYLIVIFQLLQYMHFFFLMVLVTVRD